MEKTQESNDGALGLYVHVPFCSTTCDFCAFYQERPSKKGFEEYFFALERDFEAHFTDENFSTVFIGGGTPGLLSAKQIAKLCLLIRKTGLEDGCEWTVEVAPNEINNEKIDALLKGGVNRLSLGVQTFDQKFMSELGRNHNVESALKAYQLLRSAGFESVNIDLLFGAPGQDLSDWQEDLRKAVDLEPDHISTYCLTFEEDTALYAKLARGKIKVDPERDAEFYEWAWGYLPAHGIMQYEVSNYAVKGMECRHNLNTWHMNDWIGYGPSASSQFRGVRRKNFSNINEWAKPLLLNEMGSYEESSLLSDGELARDAIMFGLRLNKGVDLDRVSAKFKVSLKSLSGIIHFLDLITKEGLAKKEGTRYFLTTDGRIRCDAIATELPDLEKEFA